MLSSNRKHEIAGDTRGNVSILFAAFLTVALTASAFAIDLGGLYLERRTAQGANDLAALAAAANLSRAEAAAKATLRANGVTDADKVVVTLGHYQPDPDLAQEQRFSPGKKPYNAARVDLTKKGTLYFAKSVIEQPTISVSAIGVVSDQATFSIGSRLASLNGGLGNAILGALLGGNVNLSIMDYRALFDTDIKLLSFLDVLATDLHITAGTYTELVSRDITIGQLLKALSETSAKQGTVTTTFAIEALLSSLEGSLAVPLSNLISLGPLGSLSLGEGDMGVGASVNVMSLISASAALSNGDNQVSVNLDGSIPGLVSLTLDLAIGEPMQNSAWVAVGDEGATIGTAQTRFRFLAEVGGSGILAGFRIHVPIYIELGSATATVKDISCPDGNAANATVRIAARPAVVKVWLGDINVNDLNKFSTTPAVSLANMVHSPLLDVTGKAYVEMSNLRDVDLVFNQRDVMQNTTKTAKTNDFVSSVFFSLIDNLSVTVNVIGISIDLTPESTKTILKALLTPLVQSMDSLLAPLLKMLGLQFGEVDVEVDGIRCGGAYLAG